MNKANPDARPLQEELPAETDVQELARVIPIRTETTLTRYPFHRIAKKGDVLIKQTSKNERGKVVTTWEVKHPPGPLAYKLDTLIINRRIDEMRSRGEIRQLFKLGSLAEICRELGINPSGKNTNAVKDSLKENAGALITAKLSYKGFDGTEREFEFTTTRYTVIFTGEKLPNEKRADAVYIELHPRFHEMLRHSKTRPLNYEYLKELAPAPQRLYELLSFSMFGTLTHDRPNAQMIYSEFCQSAPLTRHTEFYRVRSQMRKIHKPHIESGYIKAVEFQQSTDDNGIIDWVMKYTPGRRARHEFREFTTKRLIEQEGKRPRLIKPPPKDITLPSAHKSTQNDDPLVTELCAQGISQDTSIRLTTVHHDEVKRQLEAWPHRNKKGMNNPAAILIKFIEQGEPLPAEVIGAIKKAEEVKRGLAKKALEEARLTHEENHRNDYWQNYLKPETARLQETNAEAYAILERKLSIWNDYKDRPDLELMQQITIEDFIKESPDLRILSFWEWDETHNPESFSVK